MGFSRQEYWNRLPCPPPVNLPDPGIEPQSLLSLALEGVRFTAEPAQKCSDDLTALLDSTQALPLLSVCSAAD